MTGGRRITITTLNGLVEAVATRTPEAPCVRAPNETLSYGEVDRLAERIARRLQEMGVRQGDRVGIYQTKSARGVASLLAILKCGAAYVPIDPQAPPERARTILEHARAAVLISGGRSLSGLAEAFPNQPLLEGLIVSNLSEVDGTEPAEHSERIRQRDTDLAYVLYTSGSTGVPKGVAITHAQSLTFVHTATKAFELEPADVLASHAPFNFDLSIIDLFCAFAAGASVALIPESYLAFPAKIAELIAKAGITVWNSVPAALVQLTSHGAVDRFDLSRLRLIMFAGEPYPLKHLRTLRRLIPQAKLLNVYGQTEANSSTYYVVDQIPEDDGAYLPVGKPFENYGTLILDADNKEIVEPRREGELYVLGGAVASGYWHDPERTETAFVQHPLQKDRREIVYRTGDRVMLDEHRDLLFLGRMDRVVKCKGFRVELGEVESVVASHPCVRECAVLAIPDEAAGNLLVLFLAPEVLAPKSGGSISESEIRTLLAKRLPRYMLPEAMVSLESLPKTGTGKLDRKRLQQLALEAIGKVHTG